MWQTMHNCHQVQNHISQQLNHLTDQQIPEATTESRQQAAGQLQREVTSWYQSFCKLVKFQREYARALCKWIELTNCLEDINSPQSRNSSTADTLLEKWLQELDKLPNKVRAVYSADFLISQNHTSFCKKFVCSYNAEITCHRISCADGI